LRAEYQRRTCSNQNSPRDNPAPSQSTRRRYNSPNEQLHCRHNSILTHLTKVPAHPAQGSAPKRPVRTMGRQSGQSGHGFEKPGSVRLKLSTAAKACGRPGNRRVERIGDPSKAARFPGKAARCPGKAARYLDNKCCLGKTQH